MVNRIGIPIRVAHYPPHCSKYNPIEHRLFPHAARAWSGVVFRSLDIVTTCLRSVWTSTGLKNYQENIVSWPTFGSTYTPGFYSDAVSDIGLGPGQIDTNFLPDNANKAIVADSFHMRTTVPLRPITLYSH